MMSLSSLEIVTGNRLKKQEWEGGNLTRGTNKLEQYKMQTLTSIMYFTTLDTLDAFR